MVLFCEEPCGRDRRASTSNVVTLWQDHRELQSFKVLQLPQAYLPKFPAGTSTREGILRTSAFFPAGWV